VQGAKASADGRAEWRCGRAQRRCGRSLESGLCAMRQYETKCRARPDTVPGGLQP